MIKKSILLVISFIAFSFVSNASLVTAADIKSDSFCGGANLELGSKSCSGSGDENELNKLISAIVNILSLIVGIVAVIMIIVGGFRFITSGGDAGQVGSAKTTVVYAIIGLIIVALSQVIVRFVLNKV